MGEGSGVDAEAAASILSRVTGKQFRYLCQLSGGETGAHQFFGPDGRPVVVKWDTTSEGRASRSDAVVLSERLRQEARWPVPAEYVVDAEGVSFVVQEFMSGTPPFTIDQGLVDQLLDLHSRRLGLADQNDHVRWPENLITTLVVGGNGYCLHEPLRWYDDRTRSLIKRIESFGCSLSTEDFMGDDVVHWDFHAGNLLVDDGELSAVVDTDFALVGDAGFDLVTLAVTSLNVQCQPGVRSRLLAEALDHLNDSRAQAYLGHVFVRLIDWAVRRNRSPEVDFWLASANALLTI